jgi:hypothetical protein
MKEGLWLHLQSHPDLCLKILARNTCVSTPSVLLAATPCNLQPRSAGWRMIRLSELGRVDDCGARDGLAERNRLRRQFPGGARFAFIAPERGKDSSRTSATGTGHVPVRLVSRLCRAPDVDKRGLTCQRAQRSYSIGPLKEIRASQT